MTQPARTTPGVTRQELLAAADPTGLKADRIFYPAGGHSHWHIHHGEQVLYGEVGHGWVRFEGSARVDLVPGGLVYVPIGVRHWHGARPDHPLVHIAVTAGGVTTWSDEVTEAEYLLD